ncbi:hypothetical protein Tco_0613079 [Tanacetum coccineum]
MSGRASGRQAMAFGMRTIPVGHSPFLCRLLASMSGSEPREMAPESSQAMVFPKFDMHIHTSILTAEELKDVMSEYCIPVDLHPRLPPSGLTMNKLSSRYIRIYLEHLEQGGYGFLFPPSSLPLGINPTVSLFWVFYKLCKQIHTDTDLRDDFPTHYNENDVARLAKFIIPLHPPPRHLLYVCGLTTSCRHPDRAYNIKDQDGNVIDMDTFLKLPVWTGTIVSKGSPNPDKQRLKGGSEAPRKKRKVRKNPELDLFGSESTLSPTPLQYAASKNAEDPLTVVPNDAAANVEKEVVELSGNTRVTTPPATFNKPLPCLEHVDTHEHIVSDDTEEGTLERQFVPNWGFRDDLRICTFRACKELVSHLETPAEEEFLGNLMNVKVVSHPYQSLGHDAYFMELDRLRINLQREMQARSGLSNELRLLDASHFVYQVKRIKGLEEAFEPKSVQLAMAKGRVKVLEDEKAALMAQLDQAEKDHHKLVREFIPTVVKKLHTSVEYQQSLATPVSLCFTAGWLGGLSTGRTEGQIAAMLSETRDLDIKKVAASYHLLVDDLMKVLPNVPPPPPEDEVETSATNLVDATQKSPLAVQETPADTPFETTT